MKYLHIWIPCLVIVVLAAPSVTFMLPACEDYLDEIYQPLQALKFFKTHGQAFHKYGPMPNFVLAPGYGTSLLYWKITGSFGKPSEDFPYGFKRPFQQMGFLILQGRVIFLLLGIGCFAYLAHTLRLVTENRWAIGFAFLFCVATNYALVYALPNPKPDAPMLAFSAAAIAVYIRIIYLGLTTRRGIALALLAVFAVSSKELAGPLFVLPYLGLIWLAWKSRDARKPLVVSIVMGVIAYALLNIVYAPHTWRQRMQFWLAGPGIDAGVWGGGGIRAQILGALACMLDNLGPAGAIVTVIALVAYVFNWQLKIATCRERVLLELPLISVVLFGVGRIQYPADRFYTIVCIALFPVVAAGLAKSAKPPFGSEPQGRRQAAKWVLIIAACINLWFATFTWHYLRSTFEYVTEKDAIAHARKSDTLCLLSTHKRNANSSRLDWLGYRTDPRAIQDIAATCTNLPQRIYTTKGELQFIEDARKLPARAAMMKRESGFDVSTWRGLAGLGYQEEAELLPESPKWFGFVFERMPAIENWEVRRAVIVYTRD